MDCTRMSYPFIATCIKFLGNANLLGQRKLDSIWVIHSGFLVDL